MIASLQEAIKADIVIGLQHRDPCAIGELYDRHCRIIYAVVFQLVRNTHTAEDIVQEVFLRIWTRAHLFDITRGELRAWVLAIARNCAVDYLRSTAWRMQRNSLSTDGRELFYLGAEPVDPVCYFSAEQQALQNALGRLNVNQRRVLELAYFEDLSQAEIAEALHRPLGTVKTWIRTGLSVLRGQSSGLRGCRKESAKKLGVGQLNSGRSVNGAVLYPKPESDIRSPRQGRPG